MARNTTSKNGVARAYDPNNKETPKIPPIVIGVVKSNVDATRTGTIQVYLNINGGADTSRSVVKVRYMSPFLGITSSSGDPTKGADKTGDGKFLGNPQSYGFWASSPDVGTEVVCVFINGNIDQGYYIGCVPKVGLLQMTPAIGASDKVVPNDTEATTYGGADRLPTSEVNTANPNVKKSSQVYSESKPVHSYQASILAQQGLIRDNIRGVISSSAQRESPSRVFGMSTPGGPIFEGGYTSSTIKSAVKSAKADKLKMIGRTGGHSFVMDDGTLTGQDQLVRLRSSAGHQITMSDTGQTLFIIHSNGQSWIEMGKEGTIDIYSTNSFNVRTQGDLNLHADNNININAGKNLNLYADNIKQESKNDFTVRAGGSFSGYTMGTFSFKADASIALSAGADAGLTAGGVAALQGSKINLNSGAGPAASDVASLSIKTHVDTVFSKAVGWMNPAPTGLSSIVSRAPAHQPWVGSGKGADVSKQTPTPTPEAQQTTPAVDTANASSPAAPETPVTPNAIATTPQASAGAASLSADGVTALSTQVASQAQAATDAAQAQAGVINSASGATTKMLEGAGTLMPGAGAQTAQLIKMGMPVAQALEGTLTGAGGATSASALVTNVTAQAQAVQTMITKSATSLVGNGILTGKESSNAQVGGPILAATTFGIKTATDIFKGGSSAVAGGLGLKLPGSLGSFSDSLAGGKSAGSLSESLSGGLAGLKTSLGGMIDGAKDKAASTLDSLKGAAQQAFEKVESSFTALKGGVTNSLGKSTSPDAPKSATTQASEKLDSAKAALAEAEDNLLSAKAAYRGSQSSEDLAKVQEAEKAVASATQQVAQSSTQLIQAGTTAATNAVNTALSTASGLGLKLPVTASTLNSGLNALPGGASAVMSIVNGKTGASSNPLSLMKTTLGSVTGGGSPLSDPTKLAGDLVGKTTGAITASLAESQKYISGGATDMLAKASAAGAMASIESGLAAVGDTGTKAVKVATNTFDTSAITAKVGQLLGDPKIPTPTFDEEPREVEDADEAANQQAVALAAVEDAKTQLEIAENKVGQYFKDYENGKLTEDQLNEKISNSKSDLDAAHAALESAERSYQESLTA